MCQELIGHIALGWYGVGWALHPLLATCRQLHMQCSAWLNACACAFDRDLCPCSAYRLVAVSIQQPEWMVRLAGLLLCYLVEVSGHVLMAAGLVPFPSAVRKFMHSAIASDALSAVRALQMRVRCVCRCDVCACLPHDAIPVHLSCHLLCCKLCVTNSGRR